MLKSWASGYFFSGNSFSSIARIISVAVAAGVGAGCCIPSACRYVATSLLKSLWTSLFSSFSRRRSIMPEASIPATLSDGRQKSQPLLGKGNHLTVSSFFLGLPV
jgi:hypothetical protein